jgi:beta-barrel assembly-enhancing protease
MKNTAMRRMMLTLLLLTGVTGTAYSFEDLLKGMPGIPSLSGGGRMGALPGGKLGRERQQPAVPDVSKLVAAASAGQNPEEEFSVGRHLAGTLLGAAPLVRNPAVQDYLNKVGLWVALQSERPDIAWKFGVIDSDSINAFAAPGGYVLVTRGLYTLLQGEEELAGVLGHEIAHVVRQHHWNVIKQQKMIAGTTEIAVSQSGDNALMQQYLGQGAEILARGLDKNAEYEADRMGIALARRAGYDGGGLFSVLNRLAEKTGQETSLLYATHPLPSDRTSCISEIFLANPRLLQGGKHTGRFVALD